MARDRPPLRLAVGDGENALSYLARLGARNGEWITARFASEVGISVDGIRTGREIGTLERAARLPGGALRAFTPALDTRSRTFRLGASVLRWQDWNGTRRRWCPCCLGEDRRSAILAGSTQPDAAPYHRAIWDLIPLTCCPVHGAPLRSWCPRCRTTQGWAHAPLDTCACGARLSSEKFSASVADGLSTFLAARVSGVAHPDEPELLRGTDLAECLPALERLGLAASAEPGAPWISIRAHDAVRCAGIGFGIASTWPGRFVETLDRIVAARCDDATSAGLIRTYGWVYEHWIQQAPSDGIGRALKAQLAKHAIANGVVDASEAILDRVADTSTINLKQATQQLGMGHERARRLLSRGGALPRGRRRGVGMPIDRRTVECLRSAHARRLNAKSARRILGIGRVPFKGIVDRKLLVALDGGFGTERFDATSVSSLLAQARGAAPTILAVSEGCTTLVDATRRCSVPLAEFVRRILASELSVVGTLTGSTGLDGIVVRIECTALSADDFDAAFTLQQAALRLRLHPEAVLHLARTGLLPGSRKGRVWEFVASHVERFDATHLSGTDVAAMLGTSPKAAIVRLANAGVRPLAGPPSCRQAVFRKGDVEGVLGGLYGGGGRLVSPR